MRKIKMGMVGGGRGAFIGGVHRMAAALDGQIELVCGAFSSDAAVSKASGADLFLSPERAYSSFAEMIAAEKQLPLGERMDFVSIVTPNHLHFAPAKMALENGFHVVCDKPVCFSLAEAEELEKLVAQTGLIFALTHNYTGYPMVKQARAMVQAGAFGALRKVIVEYPQGWLATRLETSNQRQAAWRTDPKKSGAVGAMGDIGTHAENLAQYVTGLHIQRLCADLSALVEGRQLDDDATVLLEFDNGAKGVLIATQIAAGEENALRLRVYGETGGLEWRQEEPNSLIINSLDESKKILRTGVGKLSPAAAAHTRIPAGHPEGFLEAFANIYRNVAKTIQARLVGEAADPLYDFPSIADGVRGMYFIERVVVSAQSSEKWTTF
jgi:predicted dehydrogenase